MTRTNPSVPRQLPDEDLLELPKAWKKHTLDWPGRGTPRPVEIDQDAPAELEDRFADSADYLEYAFRALPDPSFEEPIRAGIAGEPDPLGAALALKLLIFLDAHQPWGYWELARDAWTAQHGVTFTVQAMIEMLSIDLTWLHPRILSTQPVRIGQNRIERLNRTQRLTEWIGPVRSMLAALSHSEYDHVVTAIGRLRTTDSKRFVSAMLLPDQERWVRDACLIHASQGPLHVGWDPLWSFVSNYEHVELSAVSKIDAHRCEVGTVARLIDALGADAAPVLVNSLEKQEMPRADVRRAIFEALGRLPSDDAIAYLLENNGNARAMASARAAAKRFPVRTLRAVAAVANTATGPAKARLAGLSRSPLTQQAMAILDDDQMAAVERLRDSFERVETADTNVPECFTSPPWVKFVNRPAPTPFTGLASPQMNELRWNDGEREAFQVLADDESYIAHQGFWERSMPDDPRTDHLWFPEFLAYAPQELVGSALDRWDGRARMASASTVKAILARYSDAAVDRVMQIVKSKKDFRPAMLPIVNIEAARTAADCLSRSQSDRAVAAAWLDRHPDAAAALLIPDALGEDAKLRKAAVKAMRYLAESNREDIDTQAERYGPPAAEAVRALVEPERLDPQVERVPRIGAWADPGSLPQVLLAGGATALPAEAVRTLMTALAMDELDRPYRGVDLLALECDRASLTAFSWALYELWTASGCPAKDAWAMRQLARFADDHTVRRLSALIREWPGQGQSAKALRGIEILGATGTEASLWAVREIAEVTKFKALKKAAAAQIDAVAIRLGLSREQLADRLVPDFGLDADAPFVLDYGSRSFTVEFDEQLRPCVIEDSGKRRVNPPKPGAKDDLDLAQPAYERFTAMRKHLKKVAAEQVRRLEAAMANGRTWTGVDFRRCLVDHPLLWHLVNRLVWQRDSGDDWTSFRLAEDRTLADLEDEQLVLADDSTVRLAHPVTLGDDVERWASVLADYEILQPFEQLARPALALTAEERSSGRLSRYEGRIVDGGPLMGLLKRGWQYGDPRPGGSRRSVYFEFPEGGFIAMETEPPFHPSHRPDDDLTMEHVELALLKQDAPIDAVLISEALAAIAKISRDPRP